jgi:nicotinamidase-related amidase
MSKFQNRTQTALLVIDVQVAVVESVYKRDETVANINRLVAHARTNSIPVVWVQHNDNELPRDSAQWQIVPELSPAGNEHIVHKNYRSSFEETNLDEVLAELNVGHLIVCGAETTWCVRNTIHAAFERGYDVTIIGDAHTTNDIDWEGVVLSAKSLIEELNLTLEEYHLPGRLVKVQTTQTTVS